MLEAYLVIVHSISDLARFRQRIAGPRLGCERARTRPQVTVNAQQRRYGFVDNMFRNLLAVLLSTWPGWPL
jgi:hypothetical protein